MSAFGNDDVAVRVAEELAALGATGLLDNPWTQASGTLLEAAYTSDASRPPENPEEPGSTPTLNPVKLEQSCHASMLAAAFSSDTSGPSETHQEPGLTADSVKQEQSYHASMLAAAFCSDASSPPENPEEPGSTSHAVKQEQSYHASMLAAAFSSDASSPPPNPEEPSLIVDQVRPEQSCHASALEELEHSETQKHEEEREKQLREQNLQLQLQRELQMEWELQVQRELQEQRLKLELERESLAQRELQAQRIQHLHVLRLQQLQTMEQRWASRVLGPEALALGNTQLADHASRPSALFEALGTAEPPDSGPELRTVWTIGWPPAVDIDALIRTLLEHRIGSLVDARPAHQSQCEDLWHACAVHGLTYDRQPALGTPFAELQPGHDVAIYHAIGRLVGQARAAVASNQDGSCRRLCVLFAGDQRRPDECRRHVTNKLRSCQTDVVHINSHSNSGHTLIRREESSSRGAAISHDREIVALPSSQDSAAAPQDVAPVRQPSLGHLQQSVIQPQNGAHHGTLVYLHPFGCGNSRYLQSAPVFSIPGIRLVLPLAPRIPITAYQRRQSLSWFDIVADETDDSALDADPSSLEQMQHRLALVLEREAAMLGTDGHKRLLVGGLSQGGSAALHAVLMHHQPLAGFIGVCCSLLPCTPASGSGRLSLRFFGQGQATEAWVRQTHD
eukprot:TRINITY_DN9913_c0_g1_i1.p1 TRINITY_DN9913_c0_g1~~TRINITY_DN9913_c0_g1_i1.p1  ORF type:complete len:678 (-),score=121.90 TRINITY_DN9913_c0_g1_i1:207-2240(-)